MEKYLDEIVGGLKHKKSPDEEALEKRRKMRRVKDPERRFPADLTKRHSAIRPLMDSFDQEEELKGLVAVPHSKSIDGPVVLTSSENSSARNIYQYSSLVELGTTSENSSAWIIFQDLCSVEELGTTRENSSARKIYKYAGLAELPASFLRFGPVYYDATASDALEMAGEEAWEHILDNSPNGGDDHDQKIEDIYLDTFRWVENGARACYEDSVLERLSESQFQWMMIKDGCFFLQLVLFIVGASKELGYPNDHITFGTKKLGRKVVRGWIESMFHVGNQIPLSVLNEFMKQDFFQDVVKKHGKWERPTDLLSKKVLYDLLVLPAILYANNDNRHSSISDEQPSDILHGLQNLVLGPKISRNDSDEEDDDDEYEEEGGDLEAGATSNNDRGNAGNDSEELCISGLRRKGIYLWKSNNGAGNGIRGIRFKNRILFPGLYLPRIQLNQETELLFRNLKYYEMCQQEGQDEVRSFLGLMNKLISTQEDIKHLSSKGILEISKPQYGEKFIGMLQNLSETVTDRNHRRVLQQLRDYSFSFRCVKFKKVAMIILILTVAQTVFGILSYIVSLRQSRA